MKLEEIFEMWRKDSTIDQSAIGEELERTYKIHARYLDMLQTERLVLKSYEYEYKRKRLEAFEEYTQGPPKESQRKPPAVGRVLRQDAPMYMDADEELQALSAKIDLTQAKVDALVSIMSMITYRNNSIGNVLSWVKYTGGE